MIVRQEIGPARYLVIGMLLTAPSGLLLSMLVADGRLSLPLALGGFALVAGLAFLLLHVMRQDARLLTGYLEHLQEGPPPVAVPIPRTIAAEVVLDRILRLQAHWSRRLGDVENRLAADEAVVEALQEPLLLVDARRRVIRANGAARALFGERMMDRDLALSVRNPDVLAAVDGVLAGGAAASVEFALPLPVEQVLEVKVTPFRAGPQGDAADGDGPAVDGGGPLATPLIAIVTLHDITAIKRSEQMRADFVANASHELRTPLSTLVGFIETLRGPARDDAGARDRFLSIMQEQAGRMSRLVSDLLSLSRIELDEHTPPQGDTNLESLINSLGAMLQLKAAARGMTLRIDCPGAIPLVAGDSDQLTQVFQNLIDNAIKYGRENTEVVIALSVEERAIAPENAPRRGARRPVPLRLVKVSVTDQGDGIPRTHLPRLTERFYRVDAARSRSLGGTGLGLAIVKHIVNRHRGRLTIDSELGRGSVFTVYLPAVPLPSALPGG